MDQGESEGRGLRLHQPRWEGKLKLGGWGGEAGVRDVTQGDRKLGDNQNVVGESERNQIGKRNSGGKSTALT